jgi:glutamate synthase (NADPH/NADH) small chain
VRFIRTQTVNGKLEPIPGSEFTEPCDWVIKATGQSKDTGFISLIDGLKTNANGTIAVDDHFQTTNPKYFAAGDGVSGGQEVVNAVADGKRAALAMVARHLCPTEDRQI